jgi:hypothetical protein
MIPTKTYPLSAIMGEKITDKERIAEPTAQEVEVHANWVAMVGMGQSAVLLRQYARLIKTHAEAVAENARLKAVMDKYSEDEMLCNETIDRCAKVCEELEIEFCEEYKRSGYASYHEGMTDGAGNCVEAIRALKEGNEQPAQGMVSVPGEPTGAMMVAGASCIPIQYANMVRRCYNAMIAARPK